MHPCPFRLSSEKMEIKIKFLYNMILSTALELDNDLGIFANDNLQFLNRVN